MSVIFISFVVTDSDPSWRPAYYEAVPGILKQFGGEIVASAGMLAPILLEGPFPNPQSCSVIRFPSMAHVERFMKSSEYEPFLKARQASAETGIIVFNE
jgi:uncharacterized protein (DUF1330 family)